MQSGGRLPSSIASRFVAALVAIPLRLAKVALAI